MRCNSFQVSYTCLDFRFCFGAQIYLDLANRWGFFEFVNKLKASHRRLEQLSYALERRWTHDQTTRSIDNIKRVEIESEVLKSCTNWIKLKQIVIEHLHAEKRLVISKVQLNVDIDRTKKKNVCKHEKCGGLVFCSV